MTARFVVFPLESVSKNAKTSEYSHSYNPWSYSSDAIMNLKLRLFEIGTKSNSIVEAFNVSSPINALKSLSPGH